MDFWSNSTMLSIFACQLLQLYMSGKLRSYVAEVMWYWDYADSNCDFEAVRNWSHANLRLCETEVVQIGGCAKLKSSNLRLQNWGCAKRKLCDTEIARNRIANSRLCETKVVRIWGCAKLKSCETEVVRTCAGAKRATPVPAPLVVRGPNLFPLCGCSLCSIFYALFVRVFISPAPAPLPPPTRQYPSALLVS